MRKRKSHEFSPSSQQQQTHAPTQQVHQPQHQQQPASSIGTMSVGGGVMRVVAPHPIYSGQSAGRPPTDNGGPMAAKEVADINDSGEFVSGDNSMTSNGGNNVNMILEQDRFLPIANINRIMKSVLPAEGKLSKEAKECVQECITEFLLFITSEASDKCTTERRKTITGEDLLTALQTLGFDEYVEPLREFLQKYRDANRVVSNAKEDCAEFDTTLQMHPHNDGTTVATSMPSSATVVYHQGASFHHHESEQHLQQPQQQQQHFQQTIYAGNVQTVNTAAIPQQQNNRLSPVKQQQQQQRNSHPQQLQLVNVPAQTSAQQPQSAAAQPQFLVPNTLQPMQMFVDAATGQHYVCTQGTDGSQSLVAVNLTPAAAPQSAPTTSDNLSATTPAAVAPPPQPPAPRKRAAAGGAGRKANGSFATSLSGEQSVRHYLQSQAEFKLRKTAASDK